MRITNNIISNKDSVIKWWAGIVLSFVVQSDYLFAQSTRFTATDTAIINSDLRSGYHSLGNGDLKMSHYYIAQVKKKAASVRYLAGLGQALALEASSFCRGGRYQEAISPADSALLIAKQTSDSALLSLAYKIQGNIRVYLGNAVQGLEYYFKGLAIEERLAVQNNLHWYYNNIGNVYNEQLNYRKAIEYTLKGIQICKMKNDKRGLALLYSNLGNTYNSMHVNDSALYYLNLSLKNSEEIHSKFDIANVLSHIATVLMDLRQYDKAREVALKSLRLSRDNGYPDTEITALTDLGEINIRLKRYDHAESYFLQALHTSEKIDSKSYIRYCYSFLSTIYKEKGDFENAYHYYELYSEQKDSALNAENSKLITEMNTKYAAEKKEKEIELLKKNEDIQKLELSRRKNELEKQQTITISVSGGFVLLIIVASLTHGRYRLKKKANDQLQSAYDLIAEKNTVIEKSNLMITDSIHYAKKIQDAILPSEEILKEQLSENIFILFHPLHIVSGDFYWCSNIEEKTILIVADCTGHGVPGAFMSLIANTLLNEIVNEQKVTCTKEIASMLDKKIIHALHQDEGSQKHDGLDVSICCIDKRNKKFTFTGAKHVVYVHQKQLQKLKGDPFSVGGALQLGAKHFTAVTIPYETGSTFYLLTDGYCDQSGGEANKRFSSKKLEQLLNDIHAFRIEDQKTALEEAFFSWKNKTKQRDDVLILGIQA